nr:hypothetical protein [uncultured Acetatifactor sp.]
MSGGIAASSRERRFRPLCVHRFPQTGMIRMSGEGARTGFCRMRRTAGVLPRLAKTEALVSREGRKSCSEQKG